MYEILIGIISHFQYWENNLFIFQNKETDISC